MQAFLKKSVRSFFLAYKSSNPSIKNANPSFSYPIAKAKILSTKVGGIFFMKNARTYTEEAS